MTTPESFRISTHLKDIIGRDLVTNEFVAIFELVKNSIDAGATKVDIEFDPDESSIAIVDNGRGMTANDIRDKWLFVAYSEKALASTDNYRDKIKPAGQFAGSKGIGRFACDTLGEQLELYSRSSGGKSITKLDVDWTRFEKDSTKEFQTVSVNLGSVSSFPKIYNADSPKDGGTILVIKETRQEWDEDAIRWRWPGPAGVEKGLSRCVFHGRAVGRGSGLGLCGRRRAGLPQPDGHIWVGDDRGAGLRNASRGPPRCGPGGHPAGGRRRNARGS
ncbi:hypothetical protein DF286_04045 [Sphingosinicella humi]|uniref:Histidine kinase/HSP90-like ATPase domain-containing protein n=1 Tax=Allosphingosinicella humi TaxID=2068657 RepID=A0A2U2J1B6_9SPHN|nr:hypothetical protein DF286_04045 [Sphingosinicella humi]